MPTKTKTKLQKLLYRYGACRFAFQWDKYSTLEEAWADCEKAHLMLWLADRLGRHRLSVEVACVCARTALQYLPAGEARPLIAIESAEKWLRGEVMVGQVEAALKAAEAARDDYAAKVSAYAAHTSDHPDYYRANAAQAAAEASGAAAEAASSVRYRSNVMGNAAYLAARAVYSSQQTAEDSDAAFRAALRQMSDIVRSIIPIEALTQREMD